MKFSWTFTYFLNLEEKWAYDDATFSSNSYLARQNTWEYPGLNLSTV